MLLETGLQNALLLLVGCWLVPVAALGIECAVAALLPHSLAEPIAAPAPQRRAILIPAHNEAAVIGQTLERLLPGLRPTDRLVVVADNCDDATAQIAAEAGATVLERQDPERRGKGYALDYGRQYLAAGPPDGVPEVVVVIDADCEVECGTIARLCDRAVATQRPVQALYLFKPTATPSAPQLVSLFAFRVKNWVRPLGLWRLGLPCLLTGTGMAFPWAALAAAPLASGNLVEDMRLGLDLAVMGYPPLFCPEARVWGQQPGSSAAASTQRTRWEHGHLKTLACVPWLLGQGLWQRRLDLAVLALDLAVPPLALLALLGAGVTAVTTAVALLGGGWLAAWLSYLTCGLFAAAILLAWGRFGQEISLLQLLQVPRYVLWKLPLYAKFLTAPEARWIRTDRDR